MTICTYNARTLASEASIEDLVMQAIKIEYDVGLTEKRGHRSLKTLVDTGEQVFLRTCDSRGVGGVAVLVNTTLATNIDSFEQLTTRIGRLRLKRCGSTPPLTVFVAYAPTSSYDEGEIEAFYMVENFFKEDHTFYKVIVGDFNAKVGPTKKAGRTSHRDAWTTTERTGGKALRVHHGYENRSWELAVPEAALSTLEVGVNRWRVSQ